MSVSSLVTDDKRKDPRNSLESVYSSNSRLNLLNKRKKYVDNMSTQSAYKGDKFVTQRVLSAKTHRVKQLQNQLADAHYHLQELSNENRLLRAMQKKQEIALQRYENSNAELPQILNSHSEEMRIQQGKYKQLKNQLKEVSQKLKEREMQLQQIRDEHQHLLDLSKDRNLQEREKLQAQVTELTTKVQQQNETINMLQRRIALEAKNFKHQLQAEINKHKDTRHDLDLAINNADKLSTIIEMKEKMLSTAASRGGKSPTKIGSYASVGRPLSKTGKDSKGNEDRINLTHLEQNTFTKLSESSRIISSSLSHDEDTSSSETRSRYISSRNSTSNRTTPQMRKSSKSSDEIIGIAKTVQDGIADLTITEHATEDISKKMEVMKAELMNKIKNNEDSRKSSVRRLSREESMEELIIDRPKSRGMSSVSFYSNSEETQKKKDTDKKDKPIDKYCKDIIQDIEKSSKVIDVHMKQFSQNKFSGDKLVEKLHEIDKLNEIINQKTVPDEALTELNNNFKMLTEQVFTESVPKRRIFSGKSSRLNTLLDDDMSNQDLLDDLLGKK